MSAPQHLIRACPSEGCPYNTAKVAGAVPSIHHQNLVQHLRTHRASPEYAALVRTANDEKPPRQPRRTQLAPKIPCDYCVRELPKHLIDQHYVEHTLGGYAQGTTFCDRCYNWWYPVTDSLALDEHYRLGCPFEGDRSLSPWFYMGRRPEWKEGDLFGNPVPIRTKHTSSESSAFAAGPRDTPYPLVFEGTF